jgi:hypothetical protein
VVVLGAAALFQLRCGGKRGWKGRENWMGKKKMEKGGGGSTEISEKLELKKGKLLPDNTKEKTVREEEEAMENEKEKEKEREREREKEKEEKEKEREEIGRENVEEEMIEERNMGN